MSTKFIVAIMVVGALGLAAVASPFIFTWYLMVTHQSYE
jgi:hypothetical protein